ncbi:F-type H+-transporting ATPase subunit b [Faunimonas pinastri]|uniref:ATP synthase subunit b n=1 Tax=Faunimonas pinastri TaxID=1855383 RepID=A0A1H8ZSI5_9HYPH|nr:ATP F0F1 synthase subunit B [Faunimonas pinastri]SEP67247.1 F-type H+-transporting ATPase subunit b [Faunimonas pinastri]
MNSATAWATFWALMGLVVFIGILVFMKIPGKMNKALDDRSAKIRDQLNEAQRLREEAQQLLAEYQRRREQAEIEARNLVEQAQREAAALAAEAQTKMAEYVERRTRAVEQRIAQAESQAIAEVRSRAVDLAAQAAASIVAEKAQGPVGTQLIDNSIAAVGTNLN